MTVAQSRSAGARATGRYILIGVITVAPLAVTWIVVDFLFGQMSRLGRPWVTTLARTISQDHPLAARLLQDDAFLSVVAAGAVLLALWTLGWAASRVVGRRMIDVAERLITLIPFVDKVYKATRKFLAVAGGTPEGERRVVLVEFPSRDMKVVGFVTRYMTDSVSGGKLAAVYVPTTPNPTSGYVEIVPLERLTFVEWTFDEAMAFVVTGGSSAPETVAYGRRET